MLKGFLQYLMIRNQYEPICEITLHPPIWQLADLVFHAFVAADVNFGRRPPLRHRQDE